MKIEINDENINEYANQKLKEYVDDQLRKRLTEIPWHKTVDSAVYECVASLITHERVQAVLDDIDTSGLIRTVSKDIAQLLIERLYEGWACEEDL